MVVPPGFRFHPTDEELLDYYLGPKVVGKPLPISIPTLDVYGIPPQALLPAAFPGMEGNIYCFAHTSRCSNKGGARFKRTVGQSGTWNSNRTSKITAGRGLVVGYRKSLSFQTSAAAADGGRMKECTGWVMDEYRLAEGKAASSEVQDLVLCKIRNRKEDALSPEDGTVEQDNAALQELLGSEGEMATMIPVGFRFDPSDRELLCYYLRRKIEGRPFPFAIPTLGVYEAAPWDLPPGFGGVNGQFFCFARRTRRSDTDERIKRAVGTLGTWYDNKDSEIVVGGELVGYNTFLSFRTPGGDGGKKGKSTGWVMHEYRLAERKGTSEFQDIVLCKIKNRKQLDEYACGKRKREFSEDDGLLLKFGKTSAGTAFEQDDAAVDPICCLPSSTPPASPQLLPMASSSLTVSLSGITWEGDGRGHASWFLDASPSYGSTAAASSWDPPWHEASSPCVPQTGFSTDVITLPAAGAASTDGVEAAPCCKTGACPLSDVASSMVVVPLCEPAPGGDQDQDIFSVADMEELVRLLAVELDSGAAANLPGDHTDQTGNQCATLLESRDQMVREQPAPLQLIPHDLQLQQQQEEEQPMPLQIIPHGLPQEQHEGVIDPARMSRRGRKVWKRLLKCMAASPVEAAAEVEMIPGSQLHADDPDWGLL